MRQNQRLVIQKEEEERGTFFHFGAKERNVVRREKIKQQGLWYEGFGKEKFIRGKVKSEGEKRRKSSGRKRIAILKKGGGNSSEASEEKQ